MNVCCEDECFGFGAGQRQPRKYRTGRKFVRLHFGRCRTLLPRDFQAAEGGGRFRSGDVLLIQTNHGLDLLRVGPYPWTGKHRVMSRVGHLSNVSLGLFLAEYYDGGASYVVLARLWGQNNHPEIALRAAEK